jgi:hypothetical protein
VALLLAGAGADVAITYHTRGPRPRLSREIEALGTGDERGGDQADPAVVDRIFAEVDRRFDGWTSSSPPASGPRRSRSAVCPTFGGGHDTLTRCRVPHDPAALQR